MPCCLFQKKADSFVKKITISLGQNLYDCASVLICSTFQATPHSLLFVVWNEDAV